MEKFVFTVGTKTYVLSNRIYRLPEYLKQSVNTKDFPSPAPFFRSLPSGFAASSQWLEGIRKWYYNAAGFNKLGLMRDDTIHENDDVKEAIRRLPENLYNDRMFRIKRALDLTMRHQILPKEQWTKYEEDKFYLEPYLKEVIRERKEREEWAKK